MLSMVRVWALTGSRLRGGIIFPVTIKIGISRWRLLTSLKRRAAQQIAGIIMSNWVGLRW
ncbi:hypothetical protein CEE39_04660 [bacterium (candidate division B38) B3_B38]|nr:MAG: hypothetical protein CEE39_04660 [bacterium (candidate division B38) B3_B38]